MDQDATLTKLQMIEGVWHGVLKRPGHDGWQPDLAVTHLDQEIEGVAVEQDLTKVAVMSACPSRPSASRTACRPL